MAAEYIYKLYHTIDYDIESICVIIHYLSIYLSVCLSIYLSIYVTTPVISNIWSLTDHLSGRIHSSNTSPRTWFMLFCKLKITSKKNVKHPPWLAPKKVDVSEIFVFFFFTSFTIPEYYAGASYSQPKEILDLDISHQVHWIPDHEFLKLNVRWKKTDSFTCAIGSKVPLFPYNRGWSESTQFRTGLYTY